MTKKPTVFDGRDDTGAPLVAGVLYAIYQTQGVPGGGMLLYYAGSGAWIDADAGEEAEIPHGAFCHGVYEFACRQNNLRADLAEAANPQREYTAQQRRYEERMYEQQCDLNNRYCANDDDALLGL